MFVPSSVTEDVVIQSKANTSNHANHVKSATQDTSASNDQTNFPVLLDTPWHLSNPWDKEFS